MCLPPSTMLGRLQIRSWTTFRHLFFHSRETSEGYCSFFLALPGHQLMNPIPRMAQTPITTIYWVSVERRMNFTLSYRWWIADTFTKINALKTNPNQYDYYGLARFRCLEDYATYYEHMPGYDRLEDPTAELAAEYYSIRSLLPILLQNWSG